MAIGKLVFKLPEEREEFELAQSANTLAAFIAEFSNLLRRRHKHRSDEVSDDALIEWNEIKNAFYELVNQYEIKDV
jgi:hypothetical protein